MNPVPTAEKKRIFKLNLVQILRGLAAVAVVIYHLDEDTLRFFNYKVFYLDYGFLGVDFFFALSGFIITYVHLKDIRGKGSVGNFIKKRIIRIYPIYWVVLTATILIGYPHFLDKPTVSPDFNFSTVNGWINVIKNYTLMPVLVPKMPVGVAWSLTYELFFYAVFALCISVGWKATKIILSVWVLGIILYSFGAIVPEWFPETLFDSMIIEFIFGCVVGYIFLESKKEMTVKKFSVLLLISVGMLIGYFTLFDYYRQSLLLAIIVGTMSSLIILFAAQRDRSSENDLKRIRIFILLGDASYSVYLTHSLYTIALCKLALIVFNISAFSGWLLVLLILMILMITLFLGVLTYVLIEKPLLEYTRKKLVARSKTVAIA